MPSTQKVTLSDKAYETLRTKLLSMPSGTHISARGMAAELGMSYTPVREALIRLHQEGYVKQIPNVGFLVNSTDVLDHIHFYQVRECLEPFIILNVIDSIGPEDIAVMTELNHQQQQAIESNNIKLFVESDIAMHMVLFNKYGNGYLSDFYYNLRSQFLARTLHLSSVGRPSVYYEHENLLAALAAHDREGALRSITEHLNSAKNHLLSTGTKSISPSLS